MIAALVFASLTLPVQVDGAGYLRFVREGRIVYARSATLEVKDGCIVSKGLCLSPTLRVPESAIRLEVDPNGNVVAATSSGKSACGRLLLAQLTGATAADRGFTVSTERATIGYPGEGSFGVIRSSNSAKSAAVNHAAKATVNIRQLSEIEGDSVTLGDIADIQADEVTKTALSATVLGTTPAIGVDMPVNLVRIKALLDRTWADLQIDTVPKAIIRRKCQTIKQDEFVAIAVKAAQEKLGAEIPMKCSDQQIDFKSPLGQVELKATSITASGTSFVVTIGVLVDSKPINSRSVTLKADASAQISSGAPVKVLMRTAGLTVEVPGKARTGGMIGQTITVVTETGSVLTGVVIGADKVEVKI